MDLQSITFGDGQVLTKAGLENPFNSITTHQISRQDLASGFAFGSDLNIDGYGIEGARHINGQIVFADEFLTGNDSDAIQAAVNYLVQAGGGTVILGPRAPGSPWIIDKTIVLASNISIEGNGGCNIALTGGLDIFQLPNDTENVLIKNLLVNGGTQSGNLVSADQNVRRVTIEDIQVGDPDAGLTTYMVGNILFCTSGGIVRDVVVSDCNVYGQTGIFDMSNGGPGSNGVLIRNCEQLGAHPNAIGPNRFIDIGGLLENLVIVGNMIDGLRSDASRGYNTGIWIQGTNGAEIMNVLIHDNFMISLEQQVVRLQYVRECSVQGNTFLDGSYENRGSFDTMEVVDCDYFRIVGNTISGTDQATGPATPRYGLNLDSCSYMVLLSNVFELLETHDADPLNLVGRYQTQDGGLRKNAVAFSHFSGNTFFIGQREVAGVNASGAGFDDMAVPGAPAASDSVRFSQLVTQMVTILGGVGVATPVASMVGDSTQGATSNNVKIATSGALVANYQYYGDG